MYFAGVDLVSLNLFDENSTLYYISFLSSKKFIDKCEFIYFFYNLKTTV